MPRTDNIACPQSFKKGAHRNHWFGGNTIYVCISAFLHLWITDHKRRIYVAPSKYRSLWFRRPINVVKLQVKWPPIVVICQSVVPSRTSPGGDSSWPSLTWHGVVFTSQCVPIKWPNPLCLICSAWNVRVSPFLLHWLELSICLSVRPYFSTFVCLSVRPDKYLNIHEWNNHTAHILFINVNIVKTM